MTKDDRGIRSDHDVCGERQRQERRSDHDVCGERQETGEKK